MMQETVGVPENVTDVHACARPIFLTINQTEKAHVNPANSVRL